ncbi:MAG TPA: NADH-quinone oxidoreductase subunit J [Bacillales bacterium]|nr:NADH-quinone oxidoreductase subunit J [Bacillales bacterium]
MNGELLAFFILALIAIGGGVLMLNMRKVIHMVVALVFTFLSIAGLYVLLSAEFVAVVQVLIYSGGVSIIMLFGIMLTRHDDRSKVSGGWLRRFFAGIGVLVFFAIMFYGIKDLALGGGEVLLSGQGQGEEQALYENNTQKIGISLYSNYIIPFEITSVLLLVALVGAITLAKRDDTEEVNDDE